MTVEAGNLFLVIFADFFMCAVLPHLRFITLCVMMLGQKGNLQSCLRNKFLKLCRQMMNVPSKELCVEFSKFKFGMLPKPTTSQPHDNVRPFEFSKLSDLDARLPFCLVSSRNVRGSKSHSMIVCISYHV